MPPKAPEAAANDEAPPGPTWEDNVDKDKLEDAEWSTFCCLLRSREQRKVGEEGAEELKGLVEYVTPQLAEASMICTIDVQALAAETVEAATAKGAAAPEPGSLQEALAELGDGEVTDQMKAAMVQSKMLADRAADMEARAAAQAAAEAAAQEAAEAADGEAPAAAAAAEPERTRIYLFVGWPSTVAEVQTLADRGVWLKAALELRNPEGFQVEPPAEDADPAELQAAAEALSAEHPLLCAIKEAAAGPASPDSVFTDLVWLESRVPAPTPPPEEDPPEDAPPVPTPDQLGAQELQRRLGKLREDVARFQGLVQGQTVHKIASLDPNYDSGYYSRVLDSIPSEQCSVPLILDFVFEQVVLNTQTEQQKLEKDAELRRERVRQMMDEAEQSVLTSQTACPTDSQLLTLLRYGDNLGRSDAVEDLEIRETMAASNARLRALMQLPGPELGSLFPLKRLTEQERGARRTELYDSTKDLGMGSVAVERALMLDQFESLLSVPGCLREHTVVECFGPDTLSQVVANANLLPVDKCSQYYPDHNVCLHALSLTPPESRIQTDKIDTTLPLRARCAEWIRSNGDSEGVSSLVEYTQPALGEQVVLSRTICDAGVKQSTKVLSPLDGAMLRTENNNGDCTLFHDNLVCGLRQQADAEIDSLFFSSFNDGSQLCVNVDAGESKLQFTDKAGLTVMLSSLGRVHQMQHNSRPAGSVAAAAPEQRVVLANGCVVLAFADGVRKLLFADGNVSERSSDGKWVSCNNLGARMSVDSEGRERFMPPVAVAEGIDFETRAHVATRTDGTAIVMHPDGTRVVKHAEGTVITCSTAGSLVVEATGFAPVRVEPETQSFTVEMSKSGTILLCNTAGATAKKTSGETVFCQQHLDYNSKMVVVHPSAASLQPNGCPHHFDLSIGAYSMVDSGGNSYRSGHNELGAAVDPWVDPLVVDAALASDQAALVAERVMVVGPPGAGRSTVCEYLTERHNHEVVDVEQLMQAALAFEEPDEGWPEGGCLEQRAQQLLEIEDGLAADNADAIELRVELLKRHLESLEGRWVVDGFPSSLAEAEALRKQDVQAQRMLLLSCSVDECCNRRLEKGVDADQTKALVEKFGAEAGKLEDMYSGKLDRIEAEASHEPGRPEQRLTAMKEQAKAAIRPGNFPGLRLQLAVSGLPGAGCTEQAKRLSSQYGCVVLQVAALAAAAGKESDGLQPADAAQLLKSAIDSEECQQYGFVIDGWPRNVAALEAAKESGIELQRLLMLGELDDDEASRRLTAQLGGGEANETAAKARIEAYNEGKDDVVQYFEGNEAAMVVVDAGTPMAEEPEPGTKASMDEVAARVHTQVELALKEASTAHLLRVFLLGPPGAGKTSQALRLCEATGAVYVSVQKLLQDTHDGTSPDAAELQQLYSSGGSWRTAPDELVVRLLGERLGAQDCQEQGWVLDGFPRNGAQAEALRDSAGVRPRQLLLLGVDEELAIERTLGKRVDPSDGKIYHVKLSASEDENVRDRVECGLDETEEQAREQLEGFTEGVEELKEMFEASGRVHSLDAAGPMQEVAAGVLQMLCPALVAKRAEEAKLAAAAAEDVAAAELPGRLRLFVVHEDGSGLEVLRPEDVKAYVEGKKADHCSEVIEEPQPGDEQASKWLAFFTQREPAKFSTPAAGAHNTVPRVLQPLLGGGKPKGSVYEYRHLVQSEQITEDQFDQVVAAQKAIDGKEQQRLDTAQMLSVADTRTVHERAAERQVAELVLAALKRDVGEEQSRAVAQMGSSQRLSTAGRKVQFSAEPEAPRAARGTRKLGGSKGLRPSYNTSRQDLLQYPGYTQYFEGEEGAEFQAQTQEPGPEIDTAAETQQLPAPPPTGMASVPEDCALQQPEHVLETVLPLPRLSNSQHLPPISDEWDDDVMEQGHRNKGVNPPLDVYGNPRNKPLVLPKTLDLRPGKQPNARFNQVEEPVRRTLKNSSALNLTMSGVGVEGRDPSRGFLLGGGDLDFGNVKAGATYRKSITMVNGGIESSRFQVKKPASCQVQYKTGMVAPGMSVMIQVLYCGTTPGPVSEMVVITTESDIFQLPITATVLEPNQYEACPQKSRATMMRETAPAATNKEQTVDT